VSGLKQEVLIFGSNQILEQLVSRYLETILSKQKLMTGQVIQQNIELFGEMTALIC
jgi:hypothetical protein